MRFIPLIPGGDYNGRIRIPRIIINNRTEKNIFAVVASTPTDVDKRAVLPKRRFYAGNIISRYEKGKDNRVYLEVDVDPVSLL